jgi:hypothetical protein
MRYLARLNAGSPVWLLIIMAGSVGGTFLFVVFTSVTF